MRTYGLFLMLISVIGWGSAAAMAGDGGGCDPIGVALKAELIFPVENVPAADWHAFAGLGAEGGGGCDPH